MKKFIKCAVFIAGLLAIPAALNFWIFKRAAAAGTGCARKGQTYKWRHGNVHYVTAGKGRPLLLLHGLAPGASHLEWDGVIDALSQKYKVYAPDMPGFGLSHKPDLTYSAYLYVSFINDFIKSVIGEAAFVAASGNSAAYAALACGIEPTRFGKLLLISPEGAGSRVLLPNAGSQFVKWLFQSPIVGTALYNLLTSRLYLAWRLRTYAYDDPQNKLLRKDVSRCHAMAHHGGPNARLPVAALMSRYVNAGITHALPDITVPVHVVWGDCDDLNPLKNYHVLESLLPNVSLTIFEGAKQLPHAQSPNKFCHVCNKFF